MSWLEAIFWVGFIGAGSALAAIAAYALCCYLPVVVGRVGAAIEGFFKPIRASAERISREWKTETRRMTLLDWLDDEMGTGDASPALDRDILRARKDAPILKRWIEREVPESVRRCVRTHRIAALAAGADYIYEIADAPECLDMRQRVVDLEDALIAKLEDYPYLTRDDTLLRDVIVMRRMRSICRHCPYLEHEALKAPALCPAAEIAGIEPDNGGADGTQHS